MPYRMMLVVRSGWVDANTAANPAPSDTPRIEARSAPTASSTARMSSARSSSVGVVNTPPRSESPQPRRSKMSSRLNSASRRKNAASDGSSQNTSTLDASP